MSILFFRLSGLGLIPDKAINDHPGASQAGHCICESTVPGRDMKRVFCLFAPARGINIPRYLSKRGKVLQS